MELFNIGFLKVTLIDIIDILIITLIFYKLYKLMRGTIAFQIFVALLLIIGFSLLAQVLNLQAVGWLLSRLTEIWVIAFIILFQPELRRLLSIIGTTRLARMFLKIDINENVSEVTDACIEIQKNGWGSLIVITRNAGLSNIIENGELLRSNINKELLISIFNPKSPLHDGAVVINNSRIEAARCTLPLSETKAFEGKKLGTRHRAGIGITEESDAVSVIVSEESQEISIAEEGRLYKCLNQEDLVNKLKEAMSFEGVSKSIKNILDVKKTGEKKKTSTHV
ncbi:MAG: diadenylate cyclase CdaA [Ignavibacteria bacterium]|nr:diadenylate cyclase CdaA [Ignavibacteria bacterium]